MRGRLLILLGAVALLIIVAVVVLMSGGTQGEDTTPVGEGTAVAGEGAAASEGASGAPPAQPVIDYEMIVVAVQDLSRGMVIPENGIGTMPWPKMRSLKRTTTLRT